MKNDTPLPRVKLKTSATGLRPWLFQKMVSAPPGLDNGALVAIEGRGDADVEVDRFKEFSAARAGVVGHGFYNRKSQIAIRVVRWGGDPVDEQYLRKRIRDSIYIRTNALQLDSITNGYRLVNSEGDDLSGLIVDRYDRVAAIEPHALAWYRRVDLVAEVLKKELDIDHVVVRVDEKVERAEGFLATPRPGEVTKSTFTERGITFEVDFTTGHKTGAFLDQRDQRDMITQHVHNRDVLDICCYQGGFAIPSAVRGGAGRVVAVDLDEKAIAVAQRNAARNGATRIEFQHADGFDYLRSIVITKRRFDVVILDPPKLAASEGDLFRAGSKYTDLNELGMRALKNNGLLFTCSCSGLVSEEMFLSYMKQAAARAKKRFRILSISGAAPDHPVSPHFLRGRYLKCVLAAVEDAS